MRRSIALAFAIVALVAVAASATAVPPTATARYDGPFSAVTIPIPSPLAFAAIPAPATVEPSAGPPVALRDPATAPVPTSAPRAQPAAAVETVVKPTPTPKPTPKPRAHAKPRPQSQARVRSTGHSLHGNASWYCNNNASRGPISSCHYQYPDTGGFNAYAAAGPRLRAALGNWRGRIVTVDGVRVKLVDWCQCYKGRSYEKLIDLYLDVYRRTGGSVTIRW